MYLLDEQHRSSYFVKTIPEQGKMGVYIFPDNRLATLGYCFYNDVSLANRNLRYIINWG